MVKIVFAYCELPCEECGESLVTNFRQFLSGEKCQQTISTIKSHHMFWDRFGTEVRFDVRLPPQSSGTAKDPEMKMRVLNFRSQQRSVMDPLPLSDCTEVQQSKCCSGLLRHEEAELLNPDNVLNPQLVGLLTGPENQKNPRAHKNKIGTSPPPPQNQNPPPPKTRNFMDMDVFPAERRHFFQVSIRLAQPFPVPELRTRILRTRGFFR